MRSSVLSGGLSGLLDRLWAQPETAPAVETAPVIEAAPVVQTAPIVEAAPLPIKKMSEAVEALQRQATRREFEKKIEDLEAYLQQHPEPFCWAAHNELRELCGTCDVAQSMRHADIILAHSIMDDYVLDALSGWQTEHDLEHAAQNLIDTAEEHPDLAHLQAACHLKASELCQEQGKQAQARSLRQSVAAIEDVSASSLAPYVELARNILAG